jgi:hypothetical protein
MRKTLLIIAALVVPVSVATVALGAPASAKGVTIVCTKLDGSKLSGCTGGDTGGSGLINAQTINWASGSITTVGRPVLEISKKLTKECVALYGSGSTEATESGAVITDAGDGIKIPGAFHVTVCIDPSGIAHGLKPSKFN